MLKGTFSFLGNSSYTSTKNGKTYHKAKFISDKGKMLECEITAPLDLLQFQKVEITVDVEQGQYTKFTLLNVTIIK